MLKIFCVLICLSAVNRGCTNAVKSIIPPKPKTVYSPSGFGSSKNNMFRLHSPSSDLSKQIYNNRLVSQKESRTTSESAARNVNSSDDNLKILMEGIKKSMEEKRKEEERRRNQEKSLPLFPMR